MPKIFRVKDIEQMSASEISQEFVDYYNRLSEERKVQFAENRPDLHSVILAWNENTSNNSDKAETEEIINDDFAEEIAAEDKRDDDIDDELIAALEIIELNAYEGLSIPELLKDDFRPVEALTIDDDRTICPAHRVPLVEYNPKFHNKSGAILFMKFFHCPECNRLFIKRSRLEKNKKQLKEWDVPYYFYDYDISKKYLLSQVQPYEMVPEEKIYIPDQWIEENPTCPIHEKSLEELPCVLKYLDKSISFGAYYCEKCKKIVLRRTGALKLEDQCAEIGIPPVEFEQLVKNTPPKVAIPGREIKPDYIMDDGKRKKYSYDYIADCYKLDDADTVVVSDSVYCTLEGHDTETVLGLIWVKERINGERKSYLFMLGYCSECQKYYMDAVDYKAIYNIGRPEVTLLLDMDDTSYMISSGEVFDIERNHLKSVEDTIKQEIDSIHSQPDYVSPYATNPFYDDGNLAFRKAESKKKYDGVLADLNGYKPRPYEYRVDISAGGKTEVYYVGSNDINLNLKYPVISANSSLGRELVHYQTVKIEKDGVEYDIKLSRQFDINDAALYGYTNLRTDEDIIFRSGITDPFLVRVLNMRKKQHNLIDIFVTIQENQNSIVDAKFERSLIVQGCAGSGKTMVLLHRLSSLKYNRPNFDFSRDAFILTPNDHFTLHIKGLAESLQIGSISRASVEQYYIGLLEDYSKDLKPTGPISSEMSVKQVFVDYIYSDEFRHDFEMQYSEVITERNELIPELQETARLMGEQPKVIDISDDSKVVQQIKNGADALSTKIAFKNKKISDADASLREKQEKKERLHSEIPVKRDKAIKALKRAAQAAKTEALISLLDRKRSIDEKKEKLAQVIAEKESIEEAIESATQKDELPLVEYINVFSAWADDEIFKKLKTITEIQESIDVNKEKCESLERILSFTFDEIVASGRSEDKDISGILGELSAARQEIEQLQNEKTRIMNGWFFGRARRLPLINTRIEEIEKTIETHKSAIREVIEIRRTEYKNTVDAKKCLNTDIITYSQDIKESIRQNQIKKITSIKRKITRLTNAIDSESVTLNGYVDEVNRFNDGMEDGDIESWLSSVSLFAPIDSLFAPTVNDDIMLYKRLKNELSQDEELYAGIDEKIAVAQAAYDEAVAEDYPPEIKEQLHKLQEKIAAYSVLGTYQKVFDATVRPFKEKHKIKSINGKYHRYDFYAQLIFAMKYYGKTVGHTRFMCIDEAQDLALNEYRLINELNGQDLILNLFGDTNQLIKENRGVSNWESIQKTFHADMFVLNENYRNTNQITRFCNESFGMNMLQTGVDGSKVREITKREFENELSDLHISTERVAVLLPRGIPKKKYLEIVKFGGNLQASDGEVIGGGKIAVMYVDEVKGIEFDKVYVIPNKMGRNEKYIAYTRALSELIIVIDESASDASTDIVIS